MLTYRKILSPKKSKEWMAVFSNTNLPPILKNEMKIMAGKLDLRKKI